MPITRDTNSNSIEQTNIPPSLIDKENKSFNMIDDGTKFGENETSLNSNEPEYIPTLVIGRTFPDLVAEYINSPRFIIIIFFIITIMFFTGNSCIKQLSDLEMPLYITAILTAIWYTISLLSFITDKIKK